MGINKLTDLKVKNLKLEPGAKIRKEFDGGGLYILLKPNGSKLWRLAYNYAGKEKTLSIGDYEYMGVKDARKFRDAAKLLLKQGIDPSAQKQVDKAAELAATENTFGTIAREWHQQQAGGWVPAHAAKTLARLEKYLIPLIGNIPIDNVTPLQLKEALTRVQDANHNETAHRTLQIAGRVFRYAISNGKTTHDITADLKGALKPVVHEHRATIINPAEVGELCRDIDNYQGRHVHVKIALKLLTLTFLRSQELRLGKWENINFEAKEWRVAAKTMKMKDPHIVPLSTQAISLLTELKNFTGQGEYLFPGFSTKGRPITDEGLLKALRTLGYSKEEMCIHGFRAMAGTLLREQGFEDHIVEIQLSHQKRNKVAAAYDYAKYLPRRREMMQFWANYIDELRNKNN